MTEKILAIGFSLASRNVEYCDFDSNTSLLDWDIVLFRPDIEGIPYAPEHYQGKPCLSDDSSFKLKECCEHWRREIKQAYEVGKTVVVFLAPLEEVYVDTGQRQHSGTGRNQRTTRIVDVYSNYKSIPASLGPLAASGSAMKLVDRSATVLAPYWDDFGGISNYEVILTAETVPASIVTRTGDKPVGAIYRYPSTGGTLLLLPDLDFLQPEFVQEKDGKSIWTPAANEFAGRLVAAMVALDRRLREDNESTPQPVWANAAEFLLSSESTLRIELLKSEAAVEEAQQRKEEIVESLRTAGAHRALLYEKGKPLERAIIRALRALGFVAQPYKDSKSEFDVVFEAEEGRLIGETEGKDTKPINVDKLRQLSMNIHEDLQREEVTSPAKAVLFGNGFRLQSLRERGEPFTEKCNSAALSNGTALVFTPDLFRPVQYLASTADASYALACRRAIVTSVGRVHFPAPPSIPQAAISDVSET